MLLFLGDFYYDYPDIEMDIRGLSTWIRNRGFKTILNLEAPITRGTAKGIKKRGPNLRQGDRAIEVLEMLNVAGVCLANNHMMDHGESGLFDTIEALDRAGIQHAGAGRDLEAALAPMILEDSGRKIVIQNFGWDIEETVYATRLSPGCSPRRNSLAVSRMKAMKKKHRGAYFVNIYHWGFEYNLLPMPFDIELAHKTIDSGCDLVIGHHPHTTQPHELYNGSHVFYSLGNFYFSSMRGAFNRKFRYKVANMCDFGTGVSLDAESGRATIELLVGYEPDRGSGIIPIDHDIVTDLEQFMPANRDYARLAKKMSANFNPILGENHSCNLLKLAYLGAIYKASAMLKKVLRFGACTNLYKMVKHAIDKSID